MAQQKWSDNGSSAKYITNEMLQPFLSAPIFTTQIEMTLSCRNLINMDLVTKSDPYCVIYMKESWQENYHEIARTECIDDTLNPEWVKKVIINYNFETIQHIKFEVRDEDPNDTFDLLGIFETKLSDLVAFSSRQYVTKLTGKSNRTNYGEIVIVTEELSNCKQIIDVQFRAENLQKLSWLCMNNDPFLVIYRSNEDGSYSVVAKTDIVYSSQNPTWKPLVMRSRSMCNGDLDRSIKIDCFDNRMNGNHKLIGTCYTSLRMIGTDSLTLANNKAHGDSRPVGELKVHKLHITEEITFLDYIRNGTQMHFAVAIDFTASNGAYTDRQSLHYLTSHRPNSYEIALQSVGEIIQQYDSSQLFPAFGFGAKMADGQVSHQFPLNGNPSHPYCSGVDEILKHYRNSLQSVQLYGPTNFAPVINNTISIASNFQDGKHYFVLLIITDGIISDMHQTKRAIVHASGLPISIIIVGVGTADFDSMDELDSDDVRLSVEGRYAERDIVQFVPLHKYLTKTGQAYVKSQADLAKEVLAEIPYQLTSFMESKNFKPQLPPTIGNPDASVIQPTAPQAH